MKKALILSVMVIFSLVAVGSVFAKGAKCPQPQKTKAAPGSIAKQDKTKKKLKHHLYHPPKSKVSSHLKGKSKSKLKLSKLKLKKFKKFKK